MGEPVAAGMHWETAICLWKLKGCKMWCLEWREEKRADDSTTAVVEQDGKGHASGIWFGGRSWGSREEKSISTKSIGGRGKENKGIKERTRKRQRITKENGLQYLQCLWYLRVRSQEESLLLREKWSCLERWWKELSPLQPQKLLRADTVWTEEGNK